MIVRLLPGGGTDSSFGTGGIVARKLLPNDSGECVWSLAMQGNNIIVAGMIGTSFGLSRLFPDGSTDTSFGRFSGVEYDYMLGGSQALNVSLNVQGDGKIIAGGLGSWSYFAVARYSSNGILDTTFNGTGYNVTTVPFSGQAIGMAQQADGKILLAGGDGQDFEVLRFTTSGILDSFFGTAGVKMVNMGGSDSASSVVVDWAGRILVGGSSGGDFAVARLLGDGTPDSTFSSNGLAFANIGAADDTLKSLTVQGDGSIVGVGSSSGNFAVARFNTKRRLYDIQDSNFNTTTLVDTLGQVVERYQYDPYGTVTVLNPDWTAKQQNEATVGWQYLHQGLRLDGISGLYNARNREYSPSLMRWMQQDPSGYIDGLNLYGYEDNRPLLMTDWNGFQATRPTTQRGQTLRVLFRGMGGKDILNNQHLVKYIFKKLNVQDADKEIFDREDDNDALKWIFGKLDKNSNMEIEASEITHLDLRLGGVSAGALAAITVSRKLNMDNERVEGYKLCVKVPVKMMVTLDPDPFSPSSVKENVARTVNYYQLHAGNSNIYRRLSDGSVGQLIGEIGPGLGPFSLLKGFKVDGYNVENIRVDDENYSEQKRSGFPYTDTDNDTWLFAKDVNHDTIVWYVSQKVVELLNGN